MIDPLIVGIVGSIIGSGGVGMSIVALRKSGPDIRNTNASTTAMEVDSLKRVIDLIDGRLGRAEKARDRLEARVHELEVAKYQDEKQIRQLQKRVEVLEKELRKLGVDPDDLFNTGEQGKI